MSLSLYRFTREDLWWNCVNICRRQDEMLYIHTERKTASFSFGIYRASDNMQYFMRKLKYFRLTLYLHIRAGLDITWVYVCGLIWITVCPENPLRDSGRVIASFRYCTLINQQSLYDFLWWGSLKNFCSDPKVYCPNLNKAIPAILPRRSTREQGRAKFGGPDFVMLHAVNRRIYAGQRHARRCRYHCLAPCTIRYWALLILFRASCTTRRVPPIWRDNFSSFVTFDFAPERIEDIYDALSPTTVLTYLSFKSRLIVHFPNGLSANNRLMIMSD